MEELVLTTPVVVTKTTTKYHVISITLDLEGGAAVGQPAGTISIVLKDENNVRSNYLYTGQPAIDMIKALNTANLSVKSLHKRVLEKLSADGFLPGSVTGTPDVP